MMSLLMFGHLLQIGGFESFQAGRILFLQLADEASVSAVHAVQAATETVFRTGLPDQAIVMKNGPFHAHLSIAKVPRRALPPGAPSAIPAEAYADLAGEAMIPGPVRVGEIQLCSLQWPTRALGVQNRHNYYNVVESIPLRRL